MKKMFELIIDGRAVLAEKGETLLAAARRAGAEIPTLCYHSALPPLGSCRLCIVEIDEGAGPKIVASCAYPVGRSTKVSTKSEKIMRGRQVILSMLHDRAPEDQRLAALCAEYNVPAERRYTLPPDLKCVLCGRCAAACAALGSGAISTVGRGTAKKVSTPYGEASEDCIGCAACAAVCPVDAIPVQDSGTERVIWNKTFNLVRCQRCGKPYAAEAALAFTRAKLPAHTHSLLNFCPKCRR